MANPPRILVTGASGFVGGGVVPRLLRDGMEVRAMVRSAERAPSGTVPVVADLTGPPPSPDDLAGVDAIVHLAARVHVMRETAADPLTEFRALNRDATHALATRAQAQGVRRFVFLSSIKVNGEGTGAHPFRADDPPAPVDPYGVSKWEAEQDLRELAARTGLEVAIIRAPLVHGPGVGGNLRRLLRWVANGIPLPLGAVHNRRRLVGRENLADLIAKALQHPAAPGGTFLAGDAESVSTPDLIRLIGEALGRAPRLVPFPPALLSLGGKLLGSGAEVSRLIGSLEIDIEPTMVRLDWRPPVALADGIRAMTLAWRDGA